MKFEEFTIKQLIQIIRMHNSLYPNRQIHYSGLKKSELVSMCKSHMMIKGYSVLSKFKPHYELNLQAVSVNN